MIKYYINNIINTYIYMAPFSSVTKCITKSKWRTKSSEKPTSSKT